MSSAQPESSSKTVFLIGDFSLESVEDKIVALGCTFQKRLLSLQPEDWIKIENDFKQIKSSGELLAVLLFLSKNSLVKLSNIEYSKNWHKLLLNIKDYNSLIFIPENCFSDEILLSFADDGINGHLVLLTNHIAFLKSYLLSEQPYNTVRIHQFTIDYKFYISRISLQRDTLPLSTIANLDILEGRISGISEKLLKTERVFLSKKEIRSVENEIEEI